MPAVKLIARASFISTLATLIAACASYDFSNKMAVLPNSAVQINTVLEIPNGEARVYIQNGEAVTSRNRDRFEVYCSVLMNGLSEPGKESLKVTPGQFDVREVRRSNDRFNDSIILVASTMWASSGLPSNTFFTLDMRLKSADQPDVRSLECVKESSLRGSHYPSFEEIEIALGDAITIDRPQQQP